MATSDKTKSYLLWLLARRDYSRPQLEKKLRARGLTPVEIIDALDALFTAGFYNEDNYKRSRTRQLLKRGLGAYAVKAKLGAERCKVSDSDIEKGFDEIGSTALAELRTLVVKALRRQSRSLEKTTDSPDERRKARTRLVQGLLRKGHKPQDIKNVLAAVESATDGDDTQDLT